MTIPAGFLSDTADHRRGGNSRLKEKSVHRAICNSQKDNVITISVEIEKKSLI
jgi:hypothetical protein